MTGAISGLVYADLQKTRDAALDAYVTMWRTT